MNIAYSLVGMTRGHASRALAVGAELIGRGHDVRFFTNLDAYELLLARFGAERVFEVNMPKYAFSNGKICIFNTLLRNTGFVFKREKYTLPLIASFGQWKPALTVSDFEPLSWWVSQKLSIPHVTLDSQRFMVSSEMPARLPLRDNIQRLAVGFMLFCFSPSAALRLVSKPFAVEKSGTNHRYVGAIVRRKVEKLQFRPTGTHFVCYLKEQLVSHLSEIQKVAKKLNLKARVFGISKEHLSNFRELQYEKTSESGFLEALSSCQFIVTTPGSQTLAETAHLGIPAYLLPEPNQFEQQINLHLALQAAPRQYQRFLGADSVDEDRVLKQTLPRDKWRGRVTSADFIESVVNGQD